MFLEAHIWYYWLLLCLICDIRYWRNEVSIIFLPSCTLFFFAFFFLWHCVQNSSPFWSSTFWSILQVLLICKIVPIIIHNPVSPEPEKGGNFALSHHFQYLFPEYTAIQVWGNFLNCYLPKIGFLKKEFHGPPNISHFVGWGRGCLQFPPPPRLGGMHTAGAGAGGGSKFLGIAVALDVAIARSSVSSFAIDFT